MVSWPARGVTRAAACEASTAEFGFEGVPSQKGKRDAAQRGGMTGKGSLKGGMRDKGGGDSGKPCLETPAPVLPC